MAAGGKRRALAFYFSVRICYMFLMSKCRRESDLGLCMTSVQPVLWKMRLGRLSKCKSKSWIRFEFVPGDTKEFKFNQNVNLNLYSEIPMNLSLSISTSWLKSLHHSGFRLAFRRSSRASSSTERAVLAKRMPLRSANFWQILRPNTF